MMHQRIYLVMALFLTLAAWGCKKAETSAGAQEADNAEPAASATPAAPADAEEPSASPDSAPPEASTPAPEDSAAKSEDVFTVKLETTKGDIIIDVHREWAPLGAERIHELVTAAYYTDVAFFRVMAGFMAQTGVSGKPKLNTEWAKKTILDEPVRHPNTRGTVTFAKPGLNGRSTQLFINLVDNKQLDSSGFSPVGQVRDMAAVDALYSGYGDGPPTGKGPNQQTIKQKGNSYLKKKFPELDYILSATIIEE